MFKSLASRQEAFVMLSLIFLLNLNFTLLRSVRSTLAVADLGSASSIPFFELFGVLPGAYLMTWALSYLLGRFSFRRVFMLTIGVFVLYFVIFALCYPSLRLSQEQGSSLLKICTMVFYVFGELWKPALIQILFWGLINSKQSLIQAKSLYPFLMLGASLGSILAGPLIVGCTSYIHQWSESLSWIIMIVAVSSLLAGGLFHRLILLTNEEVEGRRDYLSLKTSIQSCLQSPPLRCIGWIIFADYIAYSLGEVIFLEMLKLKFPTPSEYCRYMGILAFWSSSLTLLFAALIAPICVKKCRWLTVASILPIALLVIEGAFFLCLRVESVGALLFGWNTQEWVSWVVLLGSFQYCSCRAIKYTFFDSAKEMAFVALPNSMQMQGKLVVDGLCARLGRASASSLSLAFITFSGGILASSLLAGLTAFGISLSWLLATKKLSNHVESGERAFRYE